MSTGLRWKRVKVGHLRTWPKNPRRIIPERMESLKRAMAAYPEMMEARPLICLPGGVVIMGNMRLRAARELDWETIPVITVELDEQTATEWALRDNNSYGEWEMDQLQALLAEMPPDRIDLTGFAEDDAILATLNADKEPPLDGQIPDPPLTHPDSKPGEIYELGPHRLICGDATQADTADRLMLGTESAPLLFTSPPYADAREYDPEASVDLRPVTLAGVIPAFARFAQTMCLNFGIIRKDSAVYPYWDVYTSAAHEIGMKLLAWNVWDRGEAGSMGQATAMFPIHHEFILVYGGEVVKLRRTIRNKTPGTGKSGDAVRQADGTLVEKQAKPHTMSRPPGSVFHAPPHKATEAHPAVFPVGLPYEYIDAMTQPLDLVIDPFAGSGTTMVAAHALGRSCRMAEISPAYCDVIRERWRRIEAGD